MILAIVAKPHDHCANPAQIGSPALPCDTVVHTFRARYSSQSDCCDVYIMLAISPCSIVGLHRESDVYAAIQARCCVDRDRESWVF